jgi:DNA-binding NtrC family response regulator
MKVKKAKLTWLFLDDSVGQRRLIEQAILDIDPDHKVLLAGTKAEAEELIDKHPIDVLVVDYFLKGKTVDKKPITTESLITSARKRFRNLPIILISSAAGDDEHLLRVGADVAISKVSDLEANTVNLKTALKAALLKRSESAKKVTPTDLYVPDKLEKSLRIASETSSGSVAIVGKRGMGKSTFAKMLGTHFLQGKRPGSPLQYYDCQTDPVARLTHAGRSNHSVPTEEPSPVIFGTQSSNLPGLLERSVGGVLILDNTLCLNKSTLRVLASFLTEGSLELPNGRRILCDDVRLICTAAEVTPVIENVLHRFSDVGSHLT